MKLIHIRGSHLQLSNGDIRTYCVAITRSVFTWLQRLQLPFLLHFVFLAEQLKKYKILNRSKCFCPVWLCLCLLPHPIIPQPFSVALPIPHYPSPPAPPPSYPLLSPLTPLSISLVEEFYRSCQDLGEKIAPIREVYRTHQEVRRWTECYLTVHSTLDQTECLSLFQYYCLECRGGHLVTKRTTYLHTRTHTHTRAQTEYRHIFVAYSTLLISGALASDSHGWLS